MIGLPSLQAMDRAQETRIWLASEWTDMRCGFDRLAERVRAVIGEDPLSGHWFVFHSRRGDRLKVHLRGGPSRSQYRPGRDRCDETKACVSLCERGASAGDAVLRVRMLQSSTSTSVLFRIVSVVLVYAAWFTFETGAGSIFC
jgi:hypothetical protein